MTAPTSVERAPTANEMPVLGLGTWENTDPEQCAESVRTALEMGYRHADTAQIYRNEAAVGDGIAAADVEREDVFLATKIWIDNLSYHDVHETFEASLERLGVEYVDLLYVHWPAREYDPEDTLAAFDELYDDGRVRRVGVSNFLPENIAVASDHLDAPIFANQFEMHPFLPQEDLRAACEERDIEVVAYSPLARGRVFEHDTIVEIAEAHGVSPAQVSLAWLREKGVTAIPKATGGDHIGDNWASLSLDLPDADLAAIDAIDERVRTVDPGFAPWN